MSGGLEIVIALLAIALVVMIVLTVVRRPSKRDVGIDRADTDPWFQNARSTVDRGRAMVARLSDVSTTDTVSEVTLDDLDQLATRLAQLAATAPTTMDHRVCRNAAIRCRTLMGVLRPDGRGAASPSPADVVPPLRDHRAEFEAAIRDLADHVDLV